MTARADLLASRRGQGFLAGSLAASLALPLSAMITGPVFARTIGADGRGAVTVVTAPIILAVGLLAGGLYHSALYLVTVRAEDPVRVFKRVGGIGLVVSAVGTLALVLLASTLAESDASLAPLIRLSAVLLPVLLLGRVGRAVVMACGRYHRANLISVLGALGRAVLVVGAAAAGPLDTIVALVTLLGYEVGVSLAFIATAWGLPQGRSGGKPAPIPT